eukprot:5819821-Alexandrium_andersonii.AAC.1
MRVHLEGASGTSASIQLLNCGAMGAQHLRTLCVWEPASELSLALPGMTEDSPELFEEALPHLCSRATAGGQAAWWDPPSRYAPVLQALVAKGFAESSLLANGVLGYKLTALGQGSVLAFRGFCRPTTLFRPRQIPMESLSVFELLTTLEKAGWSCRVFAPRRARPADSPQPKAYAHGAPDAERFWWVKPQAATLSQ